MDANVNVDVYCRNLERIGKEGGSLIITLEIDDLPDAEEAEKMARARLNVGGAKVTVWVDVSLSGTMNGGSMMSLCRPAGMSTILKVTGQAELIILTSVLPII